MGFFTILTAEHKVTPCRRILHRAVSKNLPLTVLLHPRFDGERIFHNNEIKLLIKQRDAYYGKFQFTNNEDDWEQYRLARNIVVDTIRKRKRDYIIKEVFKYSNDKKWLWKTLKTMISNDSKNLTVRNIEVENIQYTDLDIIVNEFNEFYVKSIQDIINSINHFQNKWYIQRPITPNWQHFKLLNYKHLNKIILQQGNKKV